jgi:hypothetical protein
MNEQYGTFRRPYRPGDFRLVDTARGGTYWQSPDGLRVRIASGEGDALPGRRNAPAWALAVALLFGRTARQ